MRSPHAEEGNRPGARGGRVRASLLAAIAVLFGLSVPWYRPDDQPLELFLGLPDWAAVALLCYAAAAVLNAVAWLRTPIVDDAPLAPTLRTREPLGQAAPPGNDGGEAQ